MLQPIVAPDVLEPVDSMFLLTQQLLLTIEYILYYPFFFRCNHAKPLITYYYYYYYISFPFLSSFFFLLFSLRIT
jgi:hypothetical protein